MLAHSFHSFDLACFSVCISVMQQPTNLGLPCTRTLDLEDIQQGSEERAPSRKAPKPGDFSRVGFSPSKSPSRSSKNVPKRFKNALQLNNL